MSMHASFLKENIILNTRPPPTNRQHQQTIINQAISVAPTVPELAHRCPQVCVSLPSEKVGEKVCTFTRV